MSTSEVDIVQLDNNNYEACKQFIAENRSSNICQDLRWKTVIQQTFQHDPHYLIALENNSIVGFLPLFLVKSHLFGRALVSIPYLNAGGVLAKTSEIILPLTEHAKNIASETQAQYLELRFRNSVSELQNHLTERSHKVTFLLDLPKDPQSLLKSFSSKLRSQIKRPQKESVAVQIIPGNQASKKNVDDFYQIFSQHMRDLGTPVYPKELFNSTLKTFAEDAILTVVTIENKPASVAISLIHKDTAEIIWAASLRKYNKLSLNMYLYWSTMEYLCSKEIKTFDFGRTSKNSGGYKFKKQWGGQEVPLYWYYHKPDGEIPNASPENAKFSLAIKIWQKLPLPVANYFGPKITRHLP